MKYLPEPPSDYSDEYFAKFRDNLNEEDKLNVKSDRDNFLEDGSICLKSANGTWFKLTVDNSGNVTSSAVTIDSTTKFPEQTTNPYA